MFLNQFEKMDGCPQVGTPLRFTSMSFYVVHFLENQLINSSLINEGWNFV